MPLFQDGPQYLVDEKLLLSDSIQNLSQCIEILYEGEFLLLINYAKQLHTYEKFTVNKLPSKILSRLSPPTNTVPFLNTNFGIYSRVWNRRRAGNNRRAWKICQKERRVLNKGRA